MAWFVCRCMLVFVALSCISVNSSVPRDNSIDICKHPYGRKMCESICQSISGCSSVDEFASESRRYCRMTSGSISTRSDSLWRRVIHVTVSPVSLILGRLCDLLLTCGHVNVSGTLDMRGGQSATSDGLKPTIKSCPQDSRKGHNKTDVHRFQMTEPRRYYLGDYVIEVIERTSLLMRFKASGMVEVTFWSGNRYGRRVTIGQNKTVLIHEVFKLNHTSNEKRSVNLTEPFWKVCGFTELWFRWNNAGFLSLGKGWILGRNVIIQYQEEAKLSFSSVSLTRTGTFRTEKRKQYNEVITVEVKRDGHRSTVGMCSNNKTRVIAWARLSRTYYGLGEYGFPTIGRHFMMMTFTNPKMVYIFFSHTYQTQGAERVVTIILSQKKNRYNYEARIRYCVGVPRGEMHRRCMKTYNKRGFLYDKYRSVDKLTIWLEWDQTGYMSTGTGMTPGVHRRVYHRGEIKLRVNYIRLKFYHLKKSVKTIITACNKHTTR